MKQGIQKQEQKNIKPRSIWDNSDFYSEDIFQNYQSLVNSYVPNGSENKQRLYQELKETDEEDKIILFELHLDYVISIAKKFSRKCTKLSLMDLVQYGNIGLWRACKQFDSSYQVKFITYAYPLIEGAIRHAILNNDRMIQLPRKVHSNRKRYMAIIGRLEVDKLPINNRQIAIEMNCSEQKIEEYKRIPLDALSLEELSTYVDSDDEDLSILDVIPDDKQNIVKDVLDCDRITDIQKFFDNFGFSNFELEVLMLSNNSSNLYKEKRKEKKNIKLDYMTYKEISTIYGCSCQHVAQTLQKVLDELRKSKKTEYLVQYLSNPRAGLEMLRNFRENDSCKQKRKKVSTGQQPQSLLKFLNISREEYEYLYERLTEHEKELLWLAYGNDIENPVRSSEWKCAYIMEFYCTTVPVMREILETYQHHKAKEILQQKMLDMVAEMDLSSLLQKLSNEQAIIISLYCQGFDCYQLAEFLELPLQVVQENLEYALPIYERMMQESYQKCEKQLQIRYASCS